MKIAAAYIRVSTEEQTELSPESQIKQIREYAKRNDMFVPDEFVFADEGISGRETTKRPAFNQMIGAAKLNPKPFDCILVWKFSRFARNREDSILFKSMLRKQLDIDVVSISENLGDDKMSILVEALIEAMDEYYSINLAEEVKRGMFEKVSRGGCVSGPALGYDVVNKQYVINEDGAEIVRFIFDSFVSGTGVRTIARDLNAKGIKTITGKNFENRTVEYILRNTLYIGKIHWNPSKRTRRDYYDDNIVTVDGVHEKIIDIETFEKAQVLIAKNKKLYPKYAKSESPTEYMLRGVVRCSCCGATLTMSSAGGLQCHEYAKGKCKASHYISIKTITDLILQTISSSFETCDFHLIKRTTSTLQSDKLKNDIEKEYVKLERVKEAYETGIDTIEEYKINKSRILQQISKLEHKNAQNQTPNALDKKAFAEKNKKALLQLKNNKINEKERNEILRSFVDKIVFNRTTSEVEVFFYS